MDDYREVVVVDGALYPKLRYMGEVAFTKLLSIDMIVDIDGLFSHVAPKPLDEFARHPRPSEVGGEPVAATVRTRNDPPFGQSLDYADQLGLPTFRRSG